MSALVFVALGVAVLGLLILVGTIVFALTTRSKGVVDTSDSRD